ncbi:MAG: FAD-binding oxidoreductase [Paucibacter sp.]|nr:FAD-binding oxidoreductase [Roseateles sp.]
MSTNITAAFDAWVTALGAGNVLTAPQAQASYGQDTSAATRKILAALHVHSADELPTILRISQQFKIAVYPISTGHNWGYGSALPVQDGCVILDLSRMQKILDFDDELGVVTVEPGVTQEMLASFLEARQLPYLVPVTGAGPTCSLLANALERGYGVTPEADHFGAVTDIEAVLADGSIYRTSLNELGQPELARLFKWGIGPYSAGLFTQSGLGIVTRLSILLARRPECVKACLFSIPDDSLLEETVKRIRDIKSKLPGTVAGINLMNRHRVLSMSAPYPKEKLNGNRVIPDELLSAMGKQYQAGAWTGFITLYGTQRMVGSAQREIRKILRGVGSRIIFISPERARFLEKWTQWLPGKIGRGIAGATHTLAQSLQLVNGMPNETALPLAYWKIASRQPSTPRNPAVDGCGLLWYSPLVPMRPTDVRRYVKLIHDITPKHGIEPLITLTTLSDRLFDSTVPLVFDRAAPSDCQAAADCYEELFQTGATQGWHPYRLGIENMHKISSTLSNPANLHHRIKHMLDPEALVSPGRYS